MDRPPIPKCNHELTLLGIPINCPIIVGSGLLSDQEKNIRQLIACGAGAVVTKTIYPYQDTDLHHPESIYAIETGLLNNTTYSKHPVEKWLSILSRFQEEQLPVIASIHAPSPEKLSMLVSRIAKVCQLPLELGISCLHANDVTTDTPERVHAFAQAVRQHSDAAFSVKLTLGGHMHERAQAAIDGGAQAITLSDTISGLAFQDKQGEPALGGVCGYSGPGIKPLVLAAIYNLRQQSFTHQIMGSGGVKQGRDIHEFLWAGAQTVQVYSALHQHMLPTLKRIVDEYQKHCDTHPNRKMTP